MIKKFNEYIKENFEEEEDSYGKYHGEIETIEDIDWNQMNKLPSLYKDKYIVTIDYELILPDGEDNEALARKIAEADISKMENGEVRVDAIHKVQKRL